MASIVELDRSWNATGLSNAVPIDRTERLRRLIDRLPPADRTRLLSIAGVLDQIVQLASEHDEKPDERSGTWAQA
jgi:nitrogen-specific signal transduction histidine kinase